MRILLSFCVLLAISVTSLYAQSRDPYVPTSLQPWIDWVAERSPDAECAQIGAARECVWPGRLDLKLYPNGGSFSYGVTVDRDGVVPLPGSRESWPLRVRSFWGAEGGGNRLTVLDRDGRPSAVLKAGTHSVGGDFRWKEMPESIVLPAGIAVVNLTIEGKSQQSLKVEQGRVWLRKVVEATEFEQDKSSGEVVRLIRDGAPFQLSTIIRLEVSGQERDFVIPSVTPAGLDTISITSPFPYQLMPDGTLSLKIRPGSWEIQFESLSGKPPTSLKPVVQGNEIWVADEIWAWVPNETFRSVDVAGGIPIAPERTRLPSEWQRYSAFVMQPGSELQFTETRRGEKRAAANSLSISRQIWLDLDGTGASVRDQISGSMRSDWRLSSSQNLKLGRISSDGEEQVITKESGGSREGIELRQSNVNVVAEGRIDSASSRFEAVGWLVDPASLSINLMLPPGWKLLGVSGVDSVSGTWASTWNLLQLFILLLIAVTTAKLFGLMAGLMMMLALVLSHAEVGAPRHIWIHLVVALSIARLLPEGRLKRFVSYYYQATMVALAVLLVSFAATQLRMSLFPHLTNWEISRGMIATALHFIIEESFVLWPTGLTLLAAVYYLFLGRFRAFFGMGLLAALLVIVVGSTSIIVMAPRATFFNDTSIGENVTSMAPPSPARSLSKSYAEAGAYDMQSEQYLGAQKKLRQVDPNAITQTGVGLPDWSWFTARLSWNGAVEQTQEFQLYLLSPLLRLLMSIMQVVLFSLVAWGFARRSGVTFSLNGSINSSVAMIFALMLVSTQVQAQSFPSDSLLKELGVKLDSARCMQNCLGVSELSIEQLGDGLTFVAAVHSVGIGAWPVPGPLSEFLPLRVTIDGAETNALRRDESERVWVRIPDGVHQVRVDGQVVRSNGASIQFGIIPGHVELNASDWGVDGVSPSGEVGESIQIFRSATAPVSSERNGSTFEEISLPSWYVIERHLTLGLTWTTQTTVTRMGDLSRSDVKRFPLLDGEGVVSDAEVNEGGVLLNFGPGVSAVSWEGKIEINPAISLVASGSRLFSEVWRVSCAEMWRCSFEGVIPEHSEREGENEFQFRPFAGEKLIVNVTKPEAIAGRTTTIEKASLSWTPGERLLKGEISLSLRSSRGGYQKITLPPQVRIQSVTIDGASKQIQADRGVVLLPISPGAHEIVMRWQGDGSIYTKTVMPELSVEGGIANLRVNLNVPEGRWIIWAGGLSWGPVVQFWVELLLVLATAVFVGRFVAEPIGTFGWVLLGLGLASLPVEFLAVPLLWVFFLRWKASGPELSRWSYNLSQIGTVILTLVFMVILFQAVSRGLLMAPDMGIAGNGSTARILQWYEFGVGDQLPQPWILSFPLWIWRVVMLAWSAWLVFALIRWLGWGWSVFSARGIWKGKVRA